MTKTGMVLCVGGELVLLDPGESTYFISTICLDFYRYSQISSFFFDIDGGKNHWAGTCFTMQHVLPCNMSYHFWFYVYRYLRIVDSGGSTIIGGTKQITGRRQLEEVKLAMREALTDLGLDVPDYL